MELINSLGCVIVMARFPLAFTQINDIFDQEANTIGYFAFLDDIDKRGEVPVYCISSQLQVKFQKVNVY